MTARALVRFQRDRGLVPDGRVGRLTWAALSAPADRVERPPPGATTPPPFADPASTGTTAPPPRADPAPPGTTAPVGTPPPLTDPLPPSDSRGAVEPSLEARFETLAFAPEAGRATSTFSTDRSRRELQAEAVLRASGLWPAPEGELFVVQVDVDPPPPATPVAPALRGEARRAQRSRLAAEQRRIDDYLSRYTGETVVMKAIGCRLVEQGSRLLRSASHPGQRTSSWGPDVNADGLPDLAFLQPGVYRYDARPDAGGRFDPLPGVVTRVARDLDHDGTVSPVESTRDYVGAGIQLHYGALSGPGSIGCQTFPPEDFRMLQRLVKGAACFTYVLVHRPAEL
jgi:peptidoglycan hydrolase-like protein with peptidoglycan-binding domain